MWTGGLIRAATSAAALSRRTPSISGPEHGHKTTAVTGAGPATRRFERRLHTRAARARGQGRARYCQREWARSPSGPCSSNARSQVRSSSSERRYREQASSRLITPALIAVTTAAFRRLVHRVSADGRSFTNVIEINTNLNRPKRRAFLGRPQHCLLTFYQRTGTSGDFAKRLTIDDCRLGPPEGGGTAVGRGRGQERCGRERDGRSGVDVKSVDEP